MSSIVHLRYSAGTFTSLDRVPDQTCGVDKFVSFMDGVPRAARACVGCANFFAVNRLDACNFICDPFVVLHKLVESMDVGKLAWNLFRVGVLVVLGCFIPVMGEVIPIDCVFLVDQQCTRVLGFSGLPVIFWIGVLTLVASQVVKYSRKD